MSAPAPATPRQAALIDRIEAGRPLPAHLRGAIIALGNFDGFHAGHQAVVSRAIEMAHERGVPAIVATFDPHPVRHFNPAAPPFDLTTLDQRQRLLTVAGADALMVFRFDGALAGATPQQFVDTWLAGAGGVVTGENFAFGRARAGGMRTLAALAARRGMVARTVAPVTADGELVSSTRVRCALQAGDCAAAARMLTRPFTIEAVLRSLHNGGRSGTSATVDLAGYLRPCQGTYAVGVRRANGRLEEGAAQLAQDSLKLRLHAPDRWGDGERIEIEFTKKLSGALTRHTHEETHPQRRRSPCLFVARPRTERSPESPPRPSP